MSSTVWRKRDSLFFFFSSIHCWYLLVNHSLFCRGLLGPNRILTYLPEQSRSYICQCEPYQLSQWVSLTFASPSEKTMPCGHVCQSGSTIQRPKSESRRKEMCVRFCTGIITHTASHYILDSHSALGYLWKEEEKRKNPRALHKDVSLSEKLSSWRNCTIADASSTAAPFPCLITWPLVCYFISRLPVVIAVSNPLQGGNIERPSSRFHVPC